MRHGQRHPALAVEIGIESEACRQVMESRQESVPEHAREVRPGFVRRGSDPASGSDNSPVSDRWSASRSADRNSDAEEPGPARRY